MYKLFVNGTPVFIAHKQGGGALDVAVPDEEHVLITDNTRTKALAEMVATLNTASSYKSVYLLSRSPKQVLTRIKKHYKTINAAGGIVLDRNERLLMIFRRGKWDLPKGKLDGNESKRRAAIREVKEETGAKKLRILQQVKLYPSKQPCTFHTYKEGAENVLKATYWYLMRCNSDDPLEPQASEDITLAEWVPLDDVNERLENSYPLLREVMTFALDKV